MTMKDLKEENIQPEEQETRKIWFWTGVGVLAAAVVALGLMFTVLGIYALISSVVLSIASLAFFRTQKKRNNFKAVFALTVVSYVVLAAGIALFVGGLIYSALQPA